MTARVQAILCHHSPAPGRGRGRPVRWSFAIPDLARLLGVSPRTIRWLVAERKLDPRDLESVCRAWARRQKVAA